MTDGTLVLRPTVFSRWFAACMFGLPGLFIVGAAIIYNLGAGLVASGMALIALAALARWVEGRPRISLGDELYLRYRFGSWSAAKSRLDRVMFFEGPSGRALDIQAESGASAQTVPLVPFPRAQVAALVKRLEVAGVQLERRKSLGRVKQH